MPGMGSLFLGLGLAWLVYALLFAAIGFAIGRATAGTSARPNAAAARRMRRGRHGGRM